MIKGSKRKDLTLDTILSLVSEYSLFRYYLGRDFKLGQPIKSPFRRDDNPSFSILATSSGSLYFTDFANSKYRGTIIHLVEMLYNLDYNQALLRIDSDMGLGIVGKKLDYQSVIKTYDEPKLEKVDTFIQVKSKKFDLSEVNYWKQYHIDLQDLKNNNIYSVKKLYINRKEYTINPHDLCFGYLLDESWKIYWPYAKSKKEKWKSNVPIDRMWGMEDIKPGCDKVVITKALKDKMVLSKILPNVVATQNESTIAINNENIKILQNNCKEIYVNFDNDSVGNEACMFYNQFGFKWINVPDRYPQKDFADLAKVRGLDRVISYFEEKGII